MGAVWNSGRFAILLLISVCIPIICQAKTFTVDDDGPADFNNIQAAINDTNDGDIVLVKPGTYIGTGNRNIDFLGKAITVKSAEGWHNCTIDCKHQGRAFSFTKAELDTSILDGFNIKFGHAVSGGAIYCNSATPTIRNCRFVENYAEEFGGAIYHSSHKTRFYVTDCLFVRNTARYSGSAICSGISVDATYSNCSFYENVALWGFGAIVGAKDRSVIVINCTVLTNRGDICGGIVLSGSQTKVINSIVWGNSVSKPIYGVERHQLSGPIGEITNCCVQGWTGDLGGNGNFGDQPRLLNEDYHLQATSPCIDTGIFVSDLATQTDLDGQTRIYGTSVDIGADEYNPNTPKVNISPLSVSFTMDEGGPLPESKPIAIQNALFGIMDWYVVTDSNWLTVAPSSGSSTSDPNNTQIFIVDANDLLGGYYYGTIEIWGQDALFSPQRVSVELIVQGPSIELDNHELHFHYRKSGSLPPPQTIEISNGHVGTLNWTAIEDCNWLDISALSGVSDGESDEMTVSVDVNDLGAGTYHCRIEITADHTLNSPQYIDIELLVEGPVIGVTPNNLSFRCGTDGVNPPAQTFTLRNLNGGLLSWQLNYDCSWLSLTPTTGQSRGEPNAITCEIDSTGMSPGTYTCDVVCTDPNAFNSPVTIPVTLIVAKAIIKCTPNYITITTAEGIDPQDTKIIKVCNKDLGILNWRVVEDCNWLTVEPNTGSSTGEWDELTVMFHTSYLEPGFYNYPLEVVDPNAANTPQTIQVYLTITGSVGQVPEQFPTIQNAVDNVTDGGLVILSPGQYTGEGNRNIRCNGKAITIRSIDPNDPDIVATTIIDLDISTTSITFRGFIFDSDEGIGTILDGLTIINGTAANGAAIYCCQKTSSGGGTRPRTLAVESSQYQLEPRINNCVFINNYAQDLGGAVYIYKAAPVFRKCTFINNSGGRGAAVASSMSEPTFIDCTFVNNTPHRFIDGNRIERPGMAGAIFHTGPNDLIAYSCRFTSNYADAGGAIFAETVSGELYLEACIFENNHATSAGAIYTRNSRLYIDRCVFFGNSSDAVDRGGAIHGDQGCITTILNSIFKDNTGNDATGMAAHILFSECQSFEMYYCCVTNTNDDIAGIGNFVDNPYFAAAGYISDSNTPEDANDDFWIDGDYHLKSQAGRWDPKSSSWIQDDVTSPCIDAGDLATPLGYEPFPNGGIINMGAYGGTHEASKSYFDTPICNTIIAGDINGDCIVDSKDFAIMALHWLDEN